MNFTVIFSSLLSFIIAALSGMGVGGGGLFVIYLALFTDTPQLMAQGMNLLFFLFSAGASVTVHLAKRQIYPLLILILAVSGALGSLAGTYLAHLVSPTLLRKIFGVMLIITGTFSLKRKDTKKEEELIEKHK